MEYGISLNELSKVIKVNKSKLAYYTSKGLLTPKATVGKMFLFDRVEALKELKAIETLKKKKSTLDEIVILRRGVLKNRKKR